MSEAAMGAYPVSVAKPDRFERVHLLLRIALWILLAPVLNSGLLLAGPIITAVLVAQKNDASFHERFGETYGKVVGFIVGLQGYMSFASDDFPEWGAGGSLRYDYTPTGEPTVGSALLRIVMVIPQVIALWIVGVLEGVLGFVAVVTVLFSESVPHGVWKFLMGYVAWEARVLTYFLSMVEEYPPFSLDVEERSAD